MQRRDFVKGLATAQIAMMAPRAGSLVNRSETEGDNSAAKPSPTKADGTKRLNVVVHGTFAIVVDRKNKLGGANGAPSIYLKAPKVTGHSYVAQAFLPDPHDNLGYGVIPVWGNDYQVPAGGANTTNDSVVGAAAKTQSDVPVLAERQRLVISSKLSKTPAPIWNITLPLPAAIWPFRSTCENFFDSSGVNSDTYHANEMDQDQHCPISYVLTYDNPAKMVYFKTAAGTKLTVPWDDSGVARLHFYADPSTALVLNAMGKLPDMGARLKARQHLDMATDALNELFNPTLQLKFPAGAAPVQPLAFVPPSDPWFAKNVHPGVLVCEQLSLAERLAAQSSNQGCLQYFASTKIMPIITQCAEVESFKEEIRKLRQQGIASDESMQKMLTAPPTKPPSNCMPIIDTIDLPFP